MPHKKSKTQHVSARAKISAKSIQPLPSRPSQRNVRGSKRSGLKDMLEMPLDICQEIFSYLHPRDLVSLMWTSKSIRAFLLNRASASLWKAAMERVEDMPPCPPSLTEPAYAVLAFSPHCHNCLKSNIKFILWEFYVRYCSACRRTELITQQGQQHLQYFGRNRFSRSMYNTANIPERKTQYCHIKQLREISEIWNELKKRKNKAALDEYETEQKKRVRDISAHAQLCSEWSVAEAEAQEDVKIQIIQNRKEAIYSRLDGEGWGNEIAYMKKYPDELFEGHPRVKQAKKLTDRAWTLMRHDIISFMPDIRVARIEWEYRARINDRLHQLKNIAKELLREPRRTAQTEYRPYPIDLILSPAFKEVVTTPSSSFDRECFRAMEEALPVWIDEWQETVRAELRSCLPRTIQAREGVDPLLLVTVAFDCRCCHDGPFFFPDVMAHWCFRHVPFHGSRFYAPDAIYENMVVSRLQRLPCMTGKSAVSARGLELRRNIVQLCGKDPETTTAQDMDDLDVWLCRHSESRGMLEVLTWRRAMDSDYRRGPGTHPWTVATEDQKIQAKTSGTAITHYRNMYDRRPLWLCSRCSDRDHSKQRMEVHIHRKHSVDHPTVEDGDYYLHPDSFADESMKSALLIAVEECGSSGIH